MSARQAFIPHPPSSSEAHPHSTDVHDKDEDRDMFVNGNGKARSISALLGHKRATGTDARPQGARQSQGPGLNTNRRSFDGILRPEMVPMSIIPYPAAKQHIGVGSIQPSGGQTPRKSMGQGLFEFPRPLTPASLPRGPQKGFRIFAEGREEDIPDGNASGMGPGGDADMCGEVRAEMGGYMRAFGGPGGGRNAGIVQSSLEDDIAAPVPVCAIGQGTNTSDVGCEAENVFARSSRSLDAMNEAEVGVEKNHDLQRGFGGTKRGMRTEDTEENGWYIDDGHQAQGPAKRTRQVQHDPDEYLPISSPRMPPTPAPPTSSVDGLNPSLIAGALFENFGEYINLDEIEADWKRWRECSMDEWLKGAEKLTEEYADMLNMVKDHLRERVVAYTSMISSVEERRTEVNRNTEIINAKGEVVRENISHLGTRK